MSEPTVSPAMRTLDLTAPALLAAVRDVVEAGGGVWLVVSGWSMTPIIRPGDRVLLAQRPSVRVGDVILADVDGRPVLHRVTRATNDAVAMRGDSGRAEERLIDRPSIVACAVLLERGPRLVTLRPSVRFGLRALLNYGLVRLWSYSRALARSIRRRGLIVNE